MDGDLVVGWGTIDRPAAARPRVAIRVRAPEATYTPRADDV